VIGMGAGDAVYLLEKSGYKTKANGFGRVFRQSPLPGTPGTKGAEVSLELGFDALEMMKKDSLASGDSIQAPVMAVAPPVANKPKPKPAVTTKPKNNQTATKTKPKTTTKKATAKKRKATNTSKPKNTQR
jgi:hypothetical protein